METFEEYVPKEKAKASKVSEPIGEKEDIPIDPIAAAARLPNAPDPYWPAGISPTHLSVAEQTAGKIAEFTGSNIWHCEKCQTTMHQSQQDKRYCVNCLSIVKQGTSLAQKTNANWIDDARAMGLSIYDRQPDETNTEWEIWCAYRACYPQKLPTWRELAELTGHAVGTVLSAANKWEYKVRMIAWARDTDLEVKDKRIQAIKEMNDKQIGMARSIQEKLETAISCINPEALKPGEIVSLFKIATELERRITEYVPEVVNAEVQTATDSKLNITKPEDLSEVLGILQKAGVLDHKTIGIEQTTRIVAKGE